MVAVDGGRHERRAGELGVDRLALGRAEISLGGEGRLGRVLLVLPANGRGEVPVVPETEAKSDAPPFTAALSAQVMQADSRLDAVVGRLTLSLRQVMSLEVGETLVLQTAALNDISLETIDGQRIAGARLGQHRGMRAVKLNEAAAARTARAELKERLKLGSITLAEVLQQGETDDLVGKTKVLAVLESLPGVGKVKARRTMEEIGIADSRRVRGLGSQQREALLAAFS